MDKMILLFFLVAYALFQSPRCDGKENKNPIYNDEPVLLKTAENGKLYQIGDPSMSVNSSWYIAHLYGENDYEMGFALGLLLKDQLTYFFEYDWEEYIDMIIDTYASWIPENVRKLLEEFGPTFVLNLIYKNTKDYTPQYFFDYMGGMSDSTGIPYERILDFNYLPQLTSAGCSIIGCWGEATPSGEMIQVRDLDLSWKKVGIIPLMRFPTFHVLHYKSGNRVVNINTAGFVGSLAGFGATPNVGEDGKADYICLSQKWWPTLDSLDPFKKGFPWHFMLFDGLKTSTNVEDFIQLIEDSERTVSTYLGLGDGNDFYGVEMKFFSVKTFGWDNQTTYSEHPKIVDTVYWDKSDFQPSKSYCLSDLLQEYHGNMTAANIIQYVNAIGQTGDAMAIVYDFQDHQVYASFGLNKNAYEKQYVQLDMKKLVDEEY